MFILFPTVHKKNALKVLHHGLQLIMCVYTQNHNELSPITSVAYTAVRGQVGGRNALKETFPWIMCRGPP